MLELAVIRIFSGAGETKVSLPVNRFASGGGHKPDDRHGPPQKGQAVVADAQLSSPFRATRFVSIQGRWTRLRWIDSVASGS